MRIVQIPKYGITVRLESVPDSDQLAGQIESRIERLTCPQCSDPACCFSCDGSKGCDDAETAEDEDAVSARLRANGALDALESLILAQACAGIDITSKEYLMALTTTLDAIGNWLGD